MIMVSVNLPPPGFRKIRISRHELLLKTGLHDRHMNFWYCLPVQIPVFPFYLPNYLQVLDFSLFHFINSLFGLLQGRVLSIPCVFCGQRLIKQVVDVVFVASLNFFESPSMLDSCIEEFAESLSMLFKFLVWR